jgi:Flp pilus assembly protein TadG
MKNVSDEMSVSRGDRRQGPGAHLARRLRLFHRDERGGAIIFTLFLIVMMLMVAGYAIDTMRFENKRARLQATLDRAVLAATDLDQTLDPEAVVRDYFDKAGLLDQITNILVTESMNGRTVQATAQLDVNTMFMEGVDRLIAPASGAATESISDVEIVLVLDISGSMRSNSKIQNLRNAAREFVSTVLQNDDENRMSIAIVPFNAQVNLGPTLRARYNVTDLNGVANSNCIDLPASVFAGTDISPTLSMPQSGYFDAASSTSQTNAWVAIQAPVFSTTSSINDAVPVCKVFANNIVRLPNRNISQLQTQINGLTADGNTSIYLGMKWGLAMLDPGSRSVFTQLISGGAMASNLAGRPYDYDRDDTMKVLVLMTDGEHVSSFVLNDGYRTGLSPIYRAASDGNFSIRFTTGRPAVAGANEYWVPHRSEWRSAPWTGATTGVGVVTQQTWVQVWTTARMQWVAWQLYARALGTSNATRSSTYTTWMNNFRANTVVSTMNDQLQTTCAMARDNDIVVFGIAFEAPANGQTQIFNCASSPSHYYNASGLEISTAFRSIASQINALRLIE